MNVHKIPNGFNGGIYLPACLPGLCDKFFCHCLITDEDIIGDVTVSNPEITCDTTPNEDGAEPEEGHRTPTRDEDADSIDQAFASYERDHPNVGTKPLQEQLNIISMVSETVFMLYMKTFHEL